MTGFDGKPKPFTTVDVIPVPHSMPSNTTDSSSSVPTIDTNEMVHLLLLVVNPFCLV